MEEQLFIIPTREMRKLRPREGTGGHTQSEGPSGPGPWLADSAARVLSTVSQGTPREPLGVQGWEEGHKR